MGTPLEYLKRFLLALLGGFGFALGVAAVVFAASSYYEAKKSLEPELEELTSDQVSFTDIRPIEFTRHLALAGTITNNSKSNVAVDAEVQLLRDGNVVYTCTDYLHQTPGPGKSRSFQVECKEVERASALPGISFQVRARLVRAVK